MRGVGRVIEGLGVRPTKGKGQNFLIDGRVADRQVAAAGISQGDRVLEIGPGLGILTSRLLETGADVTCIEIDGKLAGHVRSEYPSANLIEGDALKVDWPGFDVFVSNLPYSVSTPILFKLLDADFRHAVVMVQKEFAERMVADVGTPDYSRLTVGCYVKAECAILETVPPSRFKPQPKVDSAIVSIRPRPTPFPLPNPGLYKKIVDACFGQRRKKIRTCLKNAGIVSDDEGLPYMDERIERLSPEQIGELADAVANRL
ncbi:MAG: ribosomal RNA small subunit methyltransferase A [Thermoplasmatales archaeon]|nr:ribosomal RNA small subunit methyltransferase A [Thermoplasmatales archaeon]